MVEGAHRQPIADAHWPERCGKEELDESQILKRERGREYFSAGDLILCPGNTTK